MADASKAPPSFADSRPSQSNPPEVKKALLRGDDMWHLKVKNIMCLVSLFVLT